MARAWKKRRFVPHLPRHAPIFPKNPQMPAAAVIVMLLSSSPIRPEEPARCRLVRPSEVHFTKSAAKLYSQAHWSTSQNPPAGGLAFAPRRRGPALLRSLLWRRCQAAKSRKGNARLLGQEEALREVSVNYQCAQSYKSFFFLRKKKLSD